MKKIDNLLVGLVTLLGIFTAQSVNAQRLNDSELKKNIQDITSPLHNLLRLNPKVFEYNTSNFKHLNLQSGRQYGFLAENVQDVFPEAVSQRNVQYMFGKNSYRNTAYITVDESKLIPLLVASIKEQQLQIEELNAAVEELKSKKGS